MAVPEETRTRLSQWCATRIPASERGQRQIAYTIQGDEVTILERRPPAYPELGSAWSATPLARLRRRQSAWLLDRPVGTDAWRHDADGSDPIELLDRVTV